MIQLTNMPYIHYNTELLNPHINIKQFYHHTYHFPQYSLSLHPDITPINLSLNFYKRIITYCITLMQDISLIPAWEPATVLAELEKTPLDQKILKAKLDKLYQISAYNELEYVGEVLQAYAWIKLAHEREDFSRYFVNEKGEKWFLEQFVATAIRYMIICRRFKHAVLMALTQQMIVEGLKLFSHKFDQLDKFPRMNSILRTSLEFDKQFYKLNYINDYPLLYPTQTEADIAKIDQFLASIKNGEPVDILKVDTHTKRFCWVPGTIKKQTSLSIHVQTQWDKNTISVDKKGMLVHPYGSKESLYRWRKQLKQGDYVDFQDSKSLWVKAKILERNEDVDLQGKTVSILLELEEQSQWINLGDPRIQEPGLFSSEKNVPRSITEGYLDDYNDILLDPEMNSVGIIRPEYSKSTLLIEFINVAQNELKLLDRALDAVKTRKFGIEVTSDLVGCIASLHPLLHRKFALRYLPQMIEAVLEFVNKADELTIRNFSKERFETINIALTEFLKRVKPSAERKYICEQLQLNLTIRFLQSDFLDRKLYAISLLTTLLKQSKHRVLRRSVEELLGWVREKGILPLIYNEKSHSELIARSSDFLQYYLLNQPKTEQLQPLLEWNESILKLVNDCYEYLPEDFREELVQKIKQRTNVTNKDALDIIKRTPGCQTWLLNNGGESWVSVVKEKTKKRDLINEVFTHPFAVVEKITKEVSEIYEYRFKNEFFLQLHEANYLPKVLQDQSLPFLKRVQFAAIAIETSSQIKDELFQALAPHTRRMDELPSQAQAFFVALLPKLHSKNVAQLFRDNFTDISKLETLGVGQFNFFRAVFFRLNEEQRFIERKVINSYATHHSARKEKKQSLTIRANPNQLLGMKELMSIVFGNGDLKVTQNALEFIGFLFDHLSPELAPSVVEFRSTLLQSCLSKLYTSTNNQQKYLRIISGLLDESEKNGIDAEPAVNALFLSQCLTLRIVDHFNVNKSRLLMEVPAHLTLHELRGQLARQLNAYPHELKLLLGDKELDPRLSGRVIHTLNLNSADLVAEKKSTVEKVSLCEADGSLNEKCKSVLRSMFREYSQCGLMSKPQCQKYHQRCVGEVSSLSENKVDKIYDQYDTDKDGYLTQSDFLSFYEYSAKVRESTVWSNLEMFGIRNDLEDLRELQITYPDSESMVRHLLFNNEQFMTLLIKLLQGSDSLANAAWQVASRLPLLSREQFFKLELDTSKPMLFRYWLYEVAAGERWELMTSEILDKLLAADIQTTCIGLKAAIHSPQFDVETFARILTNLKKINAQNQLSFHSQVVLDNTLKILQWFLKEHEGIRAHFAEKHADYDAILTTGLMSKNPAVRRMYCETVQTIITQSAQENIEIFEPFFRLVYTNFEKCDKATLSIQYFDLYSQLLEVLKQHTTLLPRLELNWLILTRSMISLFLGHRSTQVGLNSPPDQVAQGYLRILRKLLDGSTVTELVPLVKFLFQQSLFPESGKNKLKNAKSRKEAYELLYAICSVRDEKGDSPGLQQLFAAGFKAVYKKMSSNKASTSNYGFSSYFYSYNEARSELGYAGIRNLGCICYMISMLQQLFMTQSFRSLVLMADDGQPQCLAKRAGKQIDDNIFHQLQTMFANLELTEKQDYTPDEFCFSFKDFEGQPVNVSIQQDAQEFLNLFFDKIETSLKPTPFRRILEDTFGGKTCNQTICSNCKAVNERLEPFYPLSLEIKGYKNIEESFQKFIHGQVISDYQCDACKKKTDVTKSTLLAKVPNFFIIHLQRMCFNYDKFENEKVNSRWEFPNNLNVYPYTLDAQKSVGNASDYEFALKGIVLHYGSAEFGHYFSYIKESESRWIQFNDERVRQFDPHDIEVDCFGGEHWRRESQSAYLLVYEKVKKTPIHLEFETKDDKESVISKFSLTDSVIIHEEKKPEAEQTDEIKPLEKLDTQVEQKPAEQSNKEPEKEKIIVELNTQAIPTYVPENLRQRISKANEQFSFTLNLSNDEFAHFLHKILSIDPPSSLSTEYLELCYECFPLRTLVDEQQGTSLSEWATKRFKEIIGGHGWQFLKSFGQNWESDILSIEKSTRIGMKNLLQCVISDIIRSSNSQEQSSEKEALVRSFLQKFTDMMGGEVAKHWIRFRQYFEVWIGLISQSQTVREWCKQVKMVERLLDFILEEYSPFNREGHKKYTLRNMHYGAEFEFPLEVLTLLLKEGYELSEAERTCMRHYAFLQKVIKFPADHFNIIDYLCRNDRPLSQKFAYLILVQTGKVSQSDDIKPIIASVLRFLEIKDDFQQMRVDWLIGIPQYIENSRTNSYGVFGINPDQQVILNYISPVRALPLTQQLIKFKSRAQHVACLLLALLLQLEADGYINNLDSFPSLFAFTQPYTFWFEEFVDNYYEETHRSFIAKHYTEYGNRIKALWDNRPKRPFPSHPTYLIGKTIDRYRAKKTETNEMLEVETFDIESSLLELNEDNAFINKKNVKNFAGSEDFRVKITNSYGGSGFLNMDRSNHSSDDEEPQEKRPNNPFDKAIKGKLLRKIVIKNLTYDSLLLVARLKSPNPEPNFMPTNFEISFEIKGGGSYALTLQKKRVDEPFGEYSLELATLGQATREGYWPRQIISEVGENEHEDEEEGSEDSDEGLKNPVWVI